MCNCFWHRVGYAYCTAKKGLQWRIFGALLHAERLGMIVGGIDPDFNSDLGSK